MPTDKQKISFIVVKAIFTKYDKNKDKYGYYDFSSEDIVKEVEKDVLKYFESKEQLKKYVVNKLNAMCEDNLLARTDTYYFFY